jgi:hypothetical protein
VTVLGRIARADITSGSERCEPVLEYGVVIMAIGALMILIEDSLWALIRFWDFDGYHENIEPAKRWLTHATFIAGLAGTAVGGVMELVMYVT